MNRTLQTPEERFNELADELARLTGQDYVTAMSQAMEEMRDRLLAQGDAAAPRVIRLRVEADIPVDLLHRANR
ncbi:MAG TPA: hypothetical protein VN671_06170 [Solirubrobacterales bacterium]|nr:hypothetical protein [Solirubrobacterales bacterium]